MGYIIGAIVLAIGLKYFFDSDKQSSGSERPSGSSSRPNKADEMLESISASMTVGVYCGLGDGNLDNRETATLRRWKDEFLKKVPSEAATIIGNAMEAEIRRSMRGVSEDRLHQACQSQKSLPVEMRSMTMGLAFEIVIADKKIEPSELACLQKVARLLAIPDESYKRLEEKYLKPIQLAAATSGSKPNPVAMANPTRGMMMNWAETPISTDFGVLMTPAKSLRLISVPMPNMMTCSRGMMRLDSL